MDEPMTRQEQELLQRQLRALHPAPRHDGVMIIAAVALFAAGLVLGGALGGYRSEPTRTASIEAAPLLYPGGALPDRRQTLRR